MDTFGYPWLLTTLAVVPLLAALYWRAGARERRAREAFADPAMLARLGLGQPSWRRRLAPALVLAAVALASVAVARPIGRKPAEMERTVAMDVIVALDVSDSMAVSDAPEGRLAAAKSFVRALTAAAPANRYGLVLFAGDPVITCPPTVDMDAFLTFMDDADFGRANLPGTNIAEAIQAAGRFKKGELPRAAVVISDGGNTYGPDPEKVAGEAKPAMKIYTVGVGTPSGGRIPAGVDFFGQVEYKRDRAGRVVVSALDAKTLSAVASAGGGKYFDASDPASVDALAKELTAKTKAVHKDKFQGAREYGPYLALAAAVCAGVLLWL